MLRTQLNANEIAALQRLTGEPIVQSQDFQSSDITSTINSTSLLSSSNLCNLEEAQSTIPIPETPTNGLLVKINYAGACQADGPVRRKQIRPKFPGNEIAGTVHEIGNCLPNCNFSVGDRVLVVPEESTTGSGYAEYIPVQDSSRVIQIPNSVPLEVAAMLPGQALQAYAAVNAAKPHIQKLRRTKSCVNVMVVGGGTLGLWTLKLAQYLLGRDCSAVRMFVADNSIERLLTAQEHGCSDIIYWNDEDHEEYLVERTLDSCRGGVDVIIDYVGSQRTMQRSLKVLNREGLILVGGNSASETYFPLNTLAVKQQSLSGIPCGNLNQLMELLNAVADNKLEVPEHQVFPIEDQQQVFQDICEGRVTGRAIFKFSTQTSSHTVDNQ